MNSLIPSPELVREIEAAEIDYMVDRMEAIRSRDGNPEGVEIQRFGSATCFYSRTMPWPSFNTVKGLTDEDIEWLEPITEFYKARGRKGQLEVIPSMVGSRATWSRLG